MAKIKYPSVPAEAVINIKISGTFYIALGQLLLGLCQGLSKEEYAAIVKKMETKEPAADLRELNIILITSLLYTLEIEATNQKLTKEIEVDAPEEPTANP